MRPSTGLSERKKLDRWLLAGISLVILAGLLLALSACQTPSTGTAPGEFCLVAQPISYSKSADSKATVEQIRSHNAVGVELCGWQ